MSIRPVTVTQLSTYLKQIFDAEELLHNISVVGELSGYSNVRGTAYFTLKDATSALSCVCFSADEFSGFNNGDSVLVVGSPKYYVKGGKLNFNVIHIEHYGESILYKQFLELKAKLESLGYFDNSHKLPLPKDIKRIGVVSSEGGAVIQDIINVRTRRNPNIDIVLYPVKVQGIGAEFEIAKGIEILDNYNVDAIIVARGGGSMEDLQAYNTEVVATATYNCKKFIMSAVGHETDFTIIDFCSDLRAPTPSAAAELLCDNLQDKKSRIKNLTARLNRCVSTYLNYNQNVIKQNIISLNKFSEYILQDAKLSLNSNVSMLSNMFKVYFDKKLMHFNHKNEMLAKLNPNNVLKLGYAAVKAGNTYITSKNNVSIGQELSVCLKDGVIKANVIQVE